jgi:hypothetical protein
MRAACLRGGSGRTCLLQPLACVQLLACVELELRGGSGARAHRGASDIEEVVARAHTPMSYEL